MAKSKSKSKSKSVPKPKAPAKQGIRYTPRQRAKVLSLAAAGMPGTQIATRLGVGLETVRRWLRVASAEAKTYVAQTVPAVDATSINDVPAGATSAQVHVTSDAQVALSQALDEIRDLKQAVGHLYLEGVRMADGSRRPVDRVLVSQ